MVVFKITDSLRNKINKCRANGAAFVLFNDEEFYIYDTIEEIAKSVQRYEHKFPISIEDVEREVFNSKYMLFQFRTIDNALDFYLDKKYIKTYHEFLKNDAD